MNLTEHFYIYAPHNERFTTTLEQFADQVSNWPGLYFEMDGSFVWAIREGNSAVGQLDGMIYDRDGAIEYLDLKGTGPARAWERILQALVPTESPWKLDDLRIFDVSRGAYRSWVTAPLITKTPGA